MEKQGHHLLRVLGLWDIISIVVGIVVIIWPRIIAYIIGGYLVVVGIIIVGAVAILSYLRFGGGGEAA